MRDTTVKKVKAAHSPTGPMGQTYLVSGKQLALRRWEEEAGTEGTPHSRPYETVGLVLHGRAELYVEQQKLILEEGDAYLVPKDAMHHYRILEPFAAVEATAPPARVHGRDDPPA